MPSAGLSRRWTSRRREPPRPPRAPLRLSRLARDRTPPAAADCGDGEGGGAPPLRPPRPCDPSSAAPRRSPPPSPRPVEAAPPAARLLAGLGGSPRRGTPAWASPARPWPPSSRFLFALPQSRFSRYALLRMRGLVGGFPRSNPTTSTAPRPLRGSTALPSLDEANERLGRSSLGLCVHATRRTHQVMDKNASFAFVSRDKDFQEISWSSSEMRSSFHVENAL